ncbi:S1 RNA-binding domain-containing protein [Prochlorococcus marinus]|uniref:30S ribosomal protein S1-like protein B, putative Nbp1 n=1 Tax=Prochlorococcus marinus (strain MIT 9211) TaxID=93059 RepID=A9BEF4_PROM4|nr:S1 RNA-binding domain-containing protein [Prochlorococcus marinus]ABX08464.1 30S ribosomal protein S1-like protein B, putative Nbp1 [Prochlorococcus marinus str. MIT 9211]
MAGSESTQPNRPNPFGKASDLPRKPLQVMHISRKKEQERLRKEEKNALKEKKSADQKNDAKESIENAYPPSRPPKSDNKTYTNDLNLDVQEGVSMEDLLKEETIKSPGFNQADSMERILDDFDFDEEAFLEALNENEPIGSTGEIAKGCVIGIESDGVYVDIGGKAPGFMPKNECGLGVITNLKERFPKGLEVEVLVTREQNADGMVTISCRALVLRKSWETVMQLEKDGKTVEVTINGFNRGGVTCDLEGLRGFIPRSQLEQTENHESLVGKKLCVAFIEVNPDSRKLILSEKKAATAARFAELEIGQIVAGEILAIKPYGFFVDLGGVSGLLHQSMITNGSIRSLREVFSQGESIKALITDLDPKRGRIGLNTALLEGPPGEILVEKAKVLLEAEDRAKKVRGILKKKEESTEE